MQKETYSVALIGVGYWGPNYVRLVEGHERLTLTSVCDKDPSRFGTKLLRKNEVKLTTEAEDIIKSDSDLVVIATPASTHYRLCRDALEFGKHVLVEKPLTTSLGEAVELMRLARDRGLVLMAGQVYLYNSAVRYVKERLRGKRLLHASYLRTGLGPVRSDVNAVWDLGIHDFALSCYFTDEFPEEVFGAGGMMLGSVEDTALAWLRNRSSVASVRVSWLDPLKRREISLVTEGEMLILDDVNVSEPVKIYERGVEVVESPEAANVFKFYVKNGPAISPYLEYGEPLASQLSRFIERVERKEIPLTWEDKAALRSVALAEAVNESIRVHRSVTPLDPVKDGV